MVALKKDSLKIVMLGAGNLAFNLTKPLISSGQQIVQIVSRSPESAQELSAIAGCSYTSSPNEILPNADLYILAVPDFAIWELTRSLPKLEGIVVHTSGSTPLNALTPISENHGVFYPFQTFSKQRDVNLTDVPFCIEASNNRSLSILQNLAEALGGKPIIMESGKRQMLHLAGVFSCNFVNHMLAIAQLLAQENDLSFNLLKPLVIETISKALEGNPLESQTGPAIRGDSEIIKKHVALLSQIDDDLRDLYLSISTNILNLK